MEKHLIIKEILFLPTKFYTDENNSVYSLLKEIGYFNVYDDIQEYDILKALSDYPECFENWLLLSENKRTTSGWYFKRNEVDRYVVGYFPAKGDLQHQEYADIKEACAAFIKREIEDIRMSKEC